MSVTQESDQELLRSAQRGDTAALARAFEHYRERLIRLVSFRMDPRLRQRVSPSDIVQETFLTIQPKVARYFNPQRTSFFLWLRMEISQKLIDVHRHHFGAKMRDASRDVSIFWGAMPEIGSSVLAEHLAGRLSTASNAAIRSELTIQVQQALETMSAHDREMLVMRHFEELSLAEVAAVLQISHTAACNRYIRALERLRRAFADLPGGLEGVWP